MNVRGRTSICLFGTCPIRVNCQPYYLAISGTTQKLFQFLLVSAGRETRREFLAEQFWRQSSAERQRSALNSAIWRIKQQLNGVDGIEVICNGSMVMLSTAPYVDIDAETLSEAVHSTSSNGPVSEENAEQLAQALEACDAPFMEGVTEDWVLTERERLFNLKVRGLTILMHFRGEQRRYEDALEIGRLLLAEDPFREAAQCEVMWLYVLSGQRARALRQFQEYRQLLVDELEIEPMPESFALYDHIRQDLNCIAEQGKTTASSNIESPFRPEKLNALFSAIERSRRDMYRTIRAQLG